MLSLCMLFSLAPLSAQDSKSEDEDRETLQKINILMALARQSTDSEEELNLHRQILQSSETVKSHRPQDVDIWLVRAYSALKLDLREPGIEAARNLRLLGAEKSGRSSAPLILSQLAKKGWDRPVEVASKKAPTSREEIPVKPTMPSKISAAPATATSDDQMAPVDALWKEICDKQTTTTVQRNLCQKLLEVSDSIKTRTPLNEALWQMRAVAATEINNTDAGLEAQIVLKNMLQTDRSNKNVEDVLKLIESHAWSSPTANGVQEFPRDSDQGRALVNDALARIEEAPPERYSSDAKAQVRRVLRGAQRLFKVDTIYFDKGVAIPSSAAKDHVSRALKDEILRETLSNARSVIFVIGFADKTGSREFNKKLALERANATVDLIKKDNGIINMIYSVGIGATELVSAQQQEKNRAVEVWLLLE